MTNNTTASMLTDEQIDAIANDGHRNVAGGIYAHHVHDFARDVERALLTSPRAGLPHHVLASLECTAAWLEKGNDPQDAARELRACLAEIGAGPSAPVAELPADDAANLVTIDRRDLFGFVRGAIKGALEDASIEGAEQHEPMAASSCWSEAHARTIAVFDDLKIGEIGEQAVAADGSATADERAAFWLWFDSEWKRENPATGKITCGAWAWKTWKHLRASQAAAPAEAREPSRVGRVDIVDGSVQSFAFEQTDIPTGSYSTYIAPVLAPADAREPFQSRVQPWMLECFGPTIAADRIERNHRLLEEALELVQSLGCTASEAHQLVDCTFGRPIGEPVQEVGGVMVTLAALCLASELDMHAAGETELARISEPAMVLKIRAKWAAQPKHSPLPQAVPARCSYEWRDTGPLETDEGGAA
ncbi:hypothetical protein [Burkholderia gladioli]|uniref:hypothetical protein n=1 Tax=Burkholderia gladioli TaxID=28095 RepID=UPI001ABBA30E|nr:hypothetical protein [Burkholderia gladioli]